jgi:predicted dienelactone hydrolase
MVTLRFSLYAPVFCLAKRFSHSLALASLGVILAAAPSPTAEEVIITYGFLERTVSVDELEDFARGEGLSHQLSEYAKNLGLSDAQLATLQEALTRRADLDEVDVAQFLYTTQGQTLLRFIGEVVQTPARRSGFKAIRSGLILAAADDAEGLTVLNFLKEYPTPAVRIDVGRGFEFAGAVTRTLIESERAIALVDELAQDAPQQSEDELVTARQLINDPPPYAVRRRSLSVPSRRLEATLYLPATVSVRQTLPDSIPVIVISHGLGDKRTSYSYLGDYLARRGFVVATLDHPGSDSNQINNLLSGLSSNIVEDREFLERPRDVSAILDAIQEFANASTDFQNRLDIQNVGVVGQSFGGYTALALGGATYDPDALASACEPRPIYLNPSLLLQCQAANIAIGAVDLRDDRVKAILTVNPIGSAIFGESGFGQVTIPVMIVASTADTVAPAVPEQIEPFTWLQNEFRYLALVNRTTHFSVIAADVQAANSIPVPPALLGANPILAQEYLQILSAAFFQRHLNEDVRFDLALSPQYFKENVQRPPLDPLSLIRELTPEQLERATSD